MAIISFHSFYFLTPLSLKQSFIADVMLKIIFEELSYDSDQSDSAFK
jgi:hypothetical protein